MKNRNVNMLIKDADQLLFSAKEELQRSEEDVITHLVCYNSRQSIINYLISFLANNGEKLNKPVTMSGLLDQCRTIDARFDLIDVSSIDCRHEQDMEGYCMSVGKVKECLNTAMQTRAIAINEAPVY